MISRRVGGVEFETPMTTTDVKTTLDPLTDWIQALWTKEEITKKDIDEMQAHLDLLPETEKEMGHRRILYAIQDWHNKTHEDSTFRNGKLLQVYQQQIEEKQENAWPMTLDWAIEASHFFTPSPLTEEERADMYPEICLYERALDEIRQEPIAIYLIQELMDYFNENTSPFEYQRVDFILKEKICQLKAISPNAVSESLALIYGECSDPKVEKIETFSRLVHINRDLKKDIATK